MQVDALLRSLAPSLEIQVRSTETGEVVTRALVQLEQQKQPLSLSYGEGEALTYDFGLQGHDADAVIEYGDGAQDVIAMDATYATHTYAKPGTYHIIASTPDGRSVETTIFTQDFSFRLLSIEPAQSRLDVGSTLHCNGFGFVDGAVIVMDDVDLPTSFQSPQELAAPVDVTGRVPGPVGVHVRNPDGVTSAEIPFTFIE
ncbi:MAG TPA: hypothetical protein VLI07_18860 [Candidatus Binatus sp.]|nr:hypothetical protein [Candidatus Binatus sp.]